MTAQIVNGKVAMVSEGGSVLSIGIRIIRSQIKEIESKKSISKNTAAWLEKLREADAVWSDR